MKKLLLLTALAVFMASPALAADQAQAAPAADAVLAAPVQSEAAPACSATQPAKTGVTPLLFETPAAQPESCYPAECGSGAPPGCPTLPGCCKYKCCVC